MVRLARNVALIVLTFLLTFYVGTAVFSILDWPRPDPSMLDCNEPHCDWEDEERFPKLHLLEPLVQVTRCEPLLDNMPAAPPAEAGLIVLVDGDPGYPGAPR
jgi:hypothetical protein